jgi:thiamine-phosphate pyrophosphorylase
LWRAARRLGARRGAAKPLPPLLFFSDPIRTPSPERIVARLPRGAGVVYRAFGAEDAVACGKMIAQVARRRGVLFLVGGDGALAARLGADGVHLPQRLAGRAGLVRALRRRFLVTAAAHDLPAALRARRAGVDAIVVSPVFPSRSPSAGRAMGVRAFTALIRAAGLPAYALGGVSAGNTRRLQGSGAVGLAAIESLMSGYSAGAATAGTTAT